MGGIARTSELLDRGYDHDRIRMAYTYKRIIRIRRGWWGTLELSDAVVAAARIGGKLACASALEHHGLGGTLSNELHIAVPRSASRLRSSKADVIVHWTRNRITGSRQAVSIEQALEQANACQALAGTTWGWLPRADAGAS
jgi:predicted transcriptional regulator of viral defense system